jgi:hypothetical protein
MVILPGCWVCIGDSDRVRERVLELDLPLRGGGDGGGGCLHGSVTYRTTRSTMLITVKTTIPTTSHILYLKSK